MKLRVISTLFLCVSAPPREISAAPNPPAVSSSTPNIVIILSDDYGYGSATCYGAEKDLVYLVSISPRRLAILRRARENEAPGNKMLADTRLRLKPGEWADVRVHFNGDQIAAQVGDTITRAKHEFFNGEKKAMALMAKGRGIAFRKLDVYQNTGK